MNIKFKKIIAICLSVLCLLSATAWAEDAENVAETEAKLISEEAIEEIAEEPEKAKIPDEIKVEAGLLTALGMISDETDYSADITREETAVLLCKMIGKESVVKRAATVRYYEDVPANSYSLGYINVVTNEGLFKGRSKTVFDPDSPITYAELSKLLVTATGYNSLAERKGGFPGGYLTAASQLKILKDVTLTSKNTVSWQDAVQMVYNAMQVDILSGSLFTESGDYIELDKIKGDNLLKIAHGIYAGKGQITGTVLCKLFGTGLYRDLEIGEVEINGLLYNYDPEKLDYVESLTGHRTEYFYKEISETEHELIYVYIEDSTEISLMSYDLTKVYGFDDGENERGYLEYFIDDLTMEEPEKLDLDPELSLIVNNEKMPKVTNADLFPSCGKVTLIDSDLDEVYDVVIVINYDMRIVDVVSMYDKHIFFKSDDEAEAATPLVLNEKYVDVTYEITRDGEELSITDLREGDILGIVEGKRKNNLYYQIEVLSTYVEGTVEQIGTDEVLIDGKTYGVSPDFDLTLNNIKPGDVYKLYFNFADELFFAESQEDEITYAYVLIGAERKRGGKGTIQLKMCYHATYYGKYVDVWDTAEEVKIDGKKYSGEAIIDALRLSDYEIANVYEPFIQPLKTVEFDDEGRVKMIETVEKGITHPRAVRKYLGDGPYDEAFLNTETNERVYLTYKTQFIYVPEYWEDDNNWLFAELSEIKFDKTYSTIFWGEDNEGYPEVVFLYHTRKSGETDFMTDNQRPMLIKKTKKIYEPDAKLETWKIETLNSGGTFVYLTDDRNSDADCFTDLKPGDVVFAALTGSTISDIAKVTQIVGGQMWSCDRQARLSDPDGSYFRTINHMYGKVETIRPEPRLNKCKVFINFGDLDGDGTDDYKSENITGVPIYYYDRGDEEAMLATYAAIKSTEIYGKNEASDIYICLDEESAPNMVVIVGDK